MLIRINDPIEFPLVVHTKSGRKYNDVQFVEEDSMFSLTLQQEEKLAEWCKSKDLSAYTGACGGRFTYLFTPTNLGIIVKIKDELDQTEVDVTDYDSW